MSTLILCFVVLVLAILGMALGLLRKNKSKGELRGSCGGPETNPDCCKLKKNCAQAKDCNKQGDV